MTESTLETDFLYHLEFDSMVKTYEAQPLAIPYINEKGKRGKYVPDLKVVFTKSGAHQKGYEFSLFEIKEIKELEENKEHYALKFKAAEQYCRKVKGRFEIVTERDIRTARLRSYKFLYRYLSKHSVPKLTIDIISIVNRLQPLKIQELLDSIETTDSIKLQALPNIWHLVANNRLHIDLDQPLTNSSIIEIK